MKLYLAGPMRGFPASNFPEFYRVAELLRAGGHEVFSPAESDDEHYGPKQHGFNLREAFSRDLAWICAHADGVALLDGWQHSRGTLAEVAVATAIDLPAKHYRAF